ncbi:DUF4232 domain-containing protein [Streptomyces sp. NPDC016845]|uniref:DUF4232 domain-containing protein n=1 Tax=Streptomyces sp. NPDC016845 TaxID=3364972 RepID=UPI00379205B6
MARITARTTVLAAAALVAGLTMTACSGGDGGTKDEGAAPKATVAATTVTGTATDAEAASGTNTQAGGASKADAAKSGTGTAKSGTGTAKNGAAAGTKAAAPECKVTSLGYTLQRKNPEQQGDHLLITAVNKSGAACTVQKFPVVTPGDANGDVPLAKDDQRPAQPILVKPGSTVYSALPVYQDIKAEDDYFTSIKLSLVMNDADASGAFVTLKTPGEVEYAGKQADGIEVLSWNTRKPFDY